MLRTPTVARAAVLGATAILAATFASATEDPGGLAALDAELEDLAQQVAPSVVQVVASGYTAGGAALLVSRTVVRLGRDRRTPNGWIVTNAHVVDGARAIQVELLRLRERAMRDRSSAPQPPPARAAGRGPTWRPTSPC